MAERWYADKYGRLHHVPCKDGYANTLSSFLTASKFIGNDVYYSTDGRALSRPRLAVVEKVDVIADIESVDFVEPPLNRSGKCRGCGSCCETAGCTLYTQDKNIGEDGAATCLVYKELANEGKKSCWLFPQSGNELRSLGLEKVCGYSFYVSSAARFILSSHVTALYKKLSKTPVEPIDDEIGVRR